MTKSIKEELFYFAVRKTDGKEWINLTTCAHTPQGARDKANKIDSSLLIWERDNPVIRIAQFKLTEIERKESNRNYLLSRL